MPVTISKASGTGLRTLERLLGSRSRARLLTIFVTHPGQEFYAQRLTGMTGLADSSVRYELRRLERLGVLIARPEGRQRYYRIDDRHPLFLELKQMVYKTSGLGEILHDALAGTSGVDVAFIYGSVAKGEERPTSDLDLFVLGTPNREKLAAALDDAERRLGREINLVTMTMDEWRARISAGEGFVEELLRSPKILLIGDERSLRRA
ncbi:MAG: nucleotidyltransferase domain-containing protein [bacterium]